ncbi:Abi-alpha family protein [Thalassospira lucentensis]|uniref:Abi-alpha family protein n=1 Tax=Thalassospira lucentensis TaxID=168935 RepID=UPI003AA978BE
MNESKNVQQTDESGQSSQFSALIRDLFGESARELSAFGADWIRAARYRSSLKIWKLAKKWAQDSQLTTKQPPLKFLLPFIEHSSLDGEDETLAQMWSGLLLNASSFYETKHETYTKVLSQLSPDEARFLKTLFNSTSSNEVYEYSNFSEFFSDRHEDFETSMHNFNIPHQGYEVNDGIITFVFHGDCIGSTSNFILTDWPEGQIMLHLSSLGLVRNKTESRLINDDRSFAFSSMLSPLGYDLINSCERPE